uniref:THAP-type domain-containing protein n=1 Tax=Panagrolaimus sp. PS1159 TaxID=55785 RepID=A0AC35GU30_9BILA
MSKSSEQCVFCGWNRRTCWQNIKFYNIPREPGLKRIRWLQIFGNRPITHRDRVCSVHFRAGRPSNDPSHEDFVPHLYLSKEPPPDMVNYFNNQAADKESDCAKILAADACVELINKETAKQNENTNSNKDDDRLLPLLPKKNRNLRPAIMQRKRKQIKDEVIEDENNVIDEEDVEVEGGPPKLRKMKTSVANDLANVESSSNYSYLNRRIVSKSNNLNQYRRFAESTSRTTTAIPLDRYFVESTGIQAGQTLSIKRKTPVSTPIPRFRNPIHIQEPKIAYKIANATAPIRNKPQISSLHHHRSASNYEISQEEDLVNQQLRYIEMEAQRDEEEEELDMLEAEAEAVRLMHEQELMLQNHHHQMLVHDEHGMLEYEDGEGTYEEYYESSGFEEYEDSDILTHPRT